MLEPGADGSTADGCSGRTPGKHGVGEPRKNKWFRLELAGNELLNFFKKEKKISLN